jgi:hypothetical protein
MLLGVVALVVVVVVGGGVGAVPGVKCSCCDDENR